MENYTKTNLKYIGTSFEELDRVQQVLALREECRSYPDYVFSVDAYVTDVSANKLKAIYEKVQGNGKSYKACIDELHNVDVLIRKERTSQKEAIAPIKGEVEQKAAALKNVEVLRKQDIKAMYDTCWKKIVRVILIIVGKIFCCGNPIVYLSKEVDVVNQRYDAQQSELQKDREVLVEQIDRVQSPFKGRIDRFEVTRQTVMRAFEKFRLSENEKLTLGARTNKAVIDETRVQLEFVKKPVDTVKESEEGGNTKAAREQFLAKVEIRCRKYMHKHSDVSDEHNYKTALENSLENVDPEIKLIYGRMAKDELAQRVAEAREKGAILPPPPPPPRPARKPYVEQEVVWTRWDIECAESHGDFSHS